MNQQNLIPFEATHPGILIKDELDVHPTLTQKELAKELGVQPSFLNELIKGKRALTADLAILLEKILGIPADYWMKFQSQYEIDVARIKEKNIKRIKNIEMWNIIKEYVPIRYFMKLGYLSNNLEDDIEQIKTIYDIGGIDDLVTLFAKNKYSLYRKSEKLSIDERNLIAWSHLAQYEARKQEVNTFNFDNIPQLLLMLNETFYENKNLISSVQKLTNQFGIIFLCIDKLEKTPIDGYAFWSVNNPAIAMTCRHNRIDNFAFTLMHEIGHIVLHLKKDRSIGFIDVDKQESVDIYETEANKFAQEHLINKHCWSDIAGNVSLDDDKICNISKKHHIHPAIILGRVCHEKNHFAISTNIDKHIY